MPKNYWMVVISPENFKITRELGFTVQGLKIQQQRKLQRVEPEDRILFYVGTDRYFGGTATVTSRYFEEPAPKWKKEGSTDWKFQVKIKPAIVLEEHEYIDAHQLAPRLDYVRRWAPEDWYMAFAQSSLHLLPKKDFVLVEEEMRKIKAKNSRRHPQSAPAVPSPTPPPEEEAVLAQPGPLPAPEGPLPQTPLPPALP